MSLNPQILKDEGVDICLFFKDFGEGFAAAVAGFGVDADEAGVRAGVAFLQGCRKLEGVCGHHTVVVVCGGHEGCGIHRAGLHVVQR